MIHKNLHKIILAIKKVAGKKKCVLHEPYFDKFDPELIPTCCQIIGHRSPLRRYMAILDNYCRDFLIGKTRWF